MAQTVKNLLAIQIDLRLIPGSGRSMEEEKAIQSSILAWRVSLTEEPGGL